MITQDYLKSILDYNLNTGEFTWLTETNYHSIGDKAGRNYKSGYVVISIKSIRYYAHRLAWLYVYGELPKETIDHINHVRYDNKISNLRCANLRQNIVNQKVRKTNTSGYKGVSFDKSSGLWYASCRANGRKENLGRYKTALEAYEVYKEFSTIVNGKFNYCE